MPRLRTVINPYSELCDACVNYGAPHGRYLHHVLKLPPEVCSTIAAYAYHVYATAIARASPLLGLTGYTLLTIDT